MLSMIPGCSHTVTGSNYYFPPSSRPENAQYHLWISTEGASRKAYVAKTKKKVTLGIERGNENIFIREYEMTASSLETDVSWDKIDDLRITFFDFNEGISIYDRATAYKSGKVIFMLHFTFDPVSKTFIEYPISNELKQEGKEREKRDSDR